MTAADSALVAHTLVFAGFGLVLIGLLFSDSGQNDTAAGICIAGFLCLIVAAGFGLYHWGAVVNA